MSAAGSPFAASYAQARENFLQSAADAGLRVESTPHPLRGLDGEPLAMDVAREGDAGAARVLVLSSGCHGVEGYCGSGVQVAALRDRAWRAHAASHGVAVVYIHALNPYGFSHMRRTTHENVDLNRNFHDFSAPLPQNVGYRELHPLLVPQQWPPSDDNQRAIAGIIARGGEKAWQSVVSRGQHEFPGGLFFGGTAPSWSNLAVRDVLRTHGRRAARLAWIDVHTGLGPSGVGERIYAGPDHAGTVARAQAWWGDGGRTPITSVHDGSSTSAFLTGMMWTSVPQECPQAEYTGMALEYGTVPVMQSLQALRGEQWLDAHPQAPPQLAREIRRAVFEAFYTDTDAWREQVLQQGRQTLVQAVEGLAG